MYQTEAQFVNVCNEALTNHSIIQLYMMLWCLTSKVQKNA